LTHSEPEAKDSKKWKTEGQIKRRDSLLARWAKEHHHAIAWRTAAQINRMNILQATMSAVVEAVLSVLRQLPGRQNGANENKTDDAGMERMRVLILVDGDHLPSGEQVAEQDEDGLLSNAVWECKPGGDDKIQCIAAASMFAKKARDEFVLRHIADPEDRYGFAENKGYGTAQHLRAIVQYGLLPDHRTDRFTRKWVALHQRYVALPEDGPERRQFLDQHAPKSWVKPKTKAQPPTPPSARPTQPSPAVPTGLTALE
jgi:ribonuclease HII